MKPLRIATAVTACLLLGGCADSLARRDTVSAHAGEAVAANKAVHIIDPWPRYGSAPGRSDGARIADAMTRYRTGVSPTTQKPNAPAAQQLTLVPAAPAAAPAN
ncbi:MAG: pilus assembly protein [Rhizobiales bacterium]|nr:pilus assembly protein [Hyphomicrobiales bacterium]